MFNISAPQFKSLEWLLASDERFLCPDDPTLYQRFSLAVLYFSTNGDNWTSCGAASSASYCEGDNRFLSKVSECDWFGITCDGSGRVGRINLDENNLSGQLPDELFYMDGLFELDLDANQLTGSIPVSIGLATDLLYLDFDENLLTGEVPEVLYSLEQLRSIDLDTNKLSGTLSTRLGELSDLYIAQFDTNLFTGPIPTEIAALPGLAYFTATENELDPISALICEVNTTKLYADCDLCTATANCCIGC
uniref:L domain-like protein n=1 Tax=Grammatophora oceanica TaxID=210454 RepID=A0A7S1VCQ9_9STRA